MGKRNLYLNNTPVEEAKALYQKALGELLSPKAEWIPVTESLHRITKEAVYAKYCSPLYNAAAMDGIAVEAEKTKGASERKPLTLYPGTDFTVVDTGDPIHAPCDAVIMAEDLLEQEDGSVQITDAAASWQHVRPIGEDIVAGEMLMPGYHEIRPIDIGVLLSGGITEIEVLKKPSVAIFPTGTEIIEPGQEPRDGDIIESNSRVFEALVTEHGGAPHRFPPIADEYETLKVKVAEAVEKYDMVIVNAGSSAGTEDFTVHVLRELGEVLVHGVAIKPGKPVILAIVNGKPVIGLPGYPVSAYINFENFVIPVLQKLAGRTETAGTTVRACSFSSWSSSNISTVLCTSGSGFGVTGDCGAAVSVRQQFWFPSNRRPNSVFCEPSFFSTLLGAWTVLRGSFAILIFSILLRLRNISSRFFRLAAPPVMMIPASSLSS